MWSRGSANVVNRGFPFNFYIVISVSLVVNCPHVISSSLTHLQSFHVNELMIYAETRGLFA
jgi:hypothetical protein